MYMKQLRTNTKSLTLARYNIPALKLSYLVTVFQFRERHTATSHLLSIGLWCLTVQAQTSRFAAVYLDSIAGAAQVGVNPVITWRKWQVREEALNSEKRREPPQEASKGLLCPSGQSTGLEGLSSLISRSFL